MIEEHLLTFPQAARRLPPSGSGKPVSPSAPWRWHKKGLKRGDETVRLEAIRIGRRYYTSTEAIERFARKLAEIPDKRSPGSTADATPAKRAHAKRHRAVNRAAQELDERWCVGTE